MLNQQSTQKQEIARIARSVPDPSPRRGWGLGTRLAIDPYRLHVAELQDYGKCALIKIVTNSLVLLVMELV